MKHVETDVAVIGAGTAGLAAYRAAVQAGRRAVVIEGGPHGTTCARVGCMPSKLLIAAAEAAHATHKWSDFGIRIEGRIAVDGKAVMARVRRERDRFVGFVLKGVDAIPEGRLFHGRASFIDDRTLQIDGHTTIAFTRAVIATGSSPAIPAMLRAAKDRLVVNDHIFDWEDLPQSAAVFGPGVIGLELGQALHRLGVRARIFGRGSGIGPLSDPAVRTYATQTF
jgi:dihydrolipoamide dehydrogenase